MNTQEIPKKQLSEQVKVAAKEGSVADIERLVQEQNCFLNEPDKVSERMLFYDNATCLIHICGVVVVVVVVGGELMKDGWTALMYAAINGHKEVVGFLLQKGAEPDARDKVSYALACRWKYWLSDVIIQ